MDVLPGGDEHRRSAGDALMDVHFPCPLQEYGCTQTGDLVGVSANDGVVRPGEDRAAWRSTPGDERDPAGGDVPGQRPHAREAVSEAVVLMIDVQTPAHVALEREQIVLEAGDGRVVLGVDVRTEQRP